LSQGEGTRNPAATSISSTVSYSSKVSAVSSYSYNVGTRTCFQKERQERRKKVNHKKSKEEGTLEGMRAFGGGASGNFKPLSVVSPVFVLFLQ
jgi:hypothetical protein